MDYTRLLRSMVLAVAAGAAFAPAVRGDVARRIVADGETLAIPHAYTYYRFIVKDRDAAVSGNDERLHIAEIALYDADGNRLNTGLTLAAAEDKATTNLLAGTFAVYGQHTQWDGRAFDDNLSTYFNCWAQPFSDEWAWLYFTMRLADGAKSVASYNVAFSSANNVRSWALQGSDDHTIWIDLDEKEMAEVATLAPSGAGWCNGGRPIAVADASEHFFVERGGTLAVNGDVMVQSVYSYGGPVSIAANATLRVDVASGETADFTGGLSGSGAFENTGAGVLAVSGANSGFAGTVKASGGTLSFRPLHVTPKFNYYRFVVKDRNTSAERLRVAEIALYDADGNRINTGLSAAATAEASTTNLLSGTYAVYGQQSELESFANAFDENQSTSFKCWLQPFNAEWAWLYFTMRLSAENDVAPASYNVAFASENNVQSWALQGSDDHATWFTLDERDATAVAAIAPEGAGWCNGGTPLPLTWEGYNAPVGDVDAKWFRFTVKAVGEGADGTRTISELSLYDMQGKRLNVGLENMGRNYSVPSLPAVSFTSKYQWAPTYSSAGTHEENMFDANLSTVFSGYGFGYTPTPETSATWLSWTMRLADQTAPVASYNFAPGDAVLARMPHNWLVEASRDGTTWFEVDARSGDEAAGLLPTTATTYCNGGHPIGFTAGLDRWLCPTGAVVEVANGATLELPASGANSVAGLAIDLTAAGNAGTIANFNPVASGTLYLTSATAHPTLADTAMPVAFTGLSNAANIEGWSVVVNGVPAEEGEYALRFDENSVLRVTRKRGPTVLYMR